MKPIKRVEIIIGRKASEKVISILENAEIKGYSRMKNVEGRGDKYDRDGDYPSDVFSSVYLLVGCTNEQFEKIKEPLRQLLEENSGVCMVSDAMWLNH